MGEQVFPFAQFNLSHPAFGNVLRHAANESHFAFLIGDGYGARMKNS